jgi:hypothetical protein
VPRSHQEIEFPANPAGDRLPATGFFRPGERVRHRQRPQGRLVIRALVVARLLGLKLLTLDACVVVDEEDPLAPVAPPPPSATGPYARTRSAWSQLASPHPGPETSLTHAVQLLKQGIRTLEQSRRLRLSLADLPLSGRLPPLLGAGRGLVLRAIKRLGGEGLAFTVPGAACTPVQGKVGIPAGALGKQW